MLLFSVVSMVLLYLMQRSRASCRSIRRNSEQCRPPSGVQHRGLIHDEHQLAKLWGESTMSYFTQMAGLAFHNFVSAATGIALAIAFIRGIARREMETIGNFWVDWSAAACGCCCRSASWVRWCWFRRAWRRT